MKVDWASCIQHAKQLQKEDFVRSSGRGTGSTQPREDN
jgi:hypothetical protein